MLELNPSVSLQLCSQLCSSTLWTATELGVHTHVLLANDI